MQPIKRITIPNPCSQSWQQMTAVEQGRHCESCCKTVVDFSGMTNNEVIRQLSNVSNICGRFEQHQLANINNTLCADNLPGASWWKRALVCLTLAGTISACKVSDLVKPGTEAKTDIYKNDRKPTTGDNSKDINAVMKNKSKIMIKGNVTAKEDGLPLPGAVVKLKGTTIMAEANVNGDFKITVPAENAKLAISFVGYETKEIFVKENDNPSYKIALSSNSVSMGEVVIVKTRSSRPKNVWIRVRGILGSYSVLAPDIKDYISSNW